LGPREPRRAPSTAIHGHSPYHPGSAPGCSANRRLPLSNGTDRESWTFGLVAITGFGAPDWVRSVGGAHAPRWSRPGHPAGTLARSPTGGNATDHFGCDGRRAFPESIPKQVAIPGKEARAGTIGADVAPGGTRPDEVHRSRGPSGSTKRPD